MILGAELIPTAPKQAFQRIPVDTCLVSCLAYRLGDSLLGNMDGERSRV